MVAIESLTVKEPVEPQVPTFQAGETPEPPLRVYQFRHFRRESSDSEKVRDRQGTCDAWTRQFPSAQKARSWLS
jgi:hypothetical protein